MIGRKLVGVGRASVIPCFHFRVGRDWVRCLGRVYLAGFVHSEEATACSQRHQTNMDSRSLGVLDLHTVLKRNDITGDLGKSGLIACKFSWP